MKKFGLIALIYLIFGSVVHAQWKKTNGPEAGEVGEMLEFDGYLFISAGAGGVYRSNDKGLNWLEINNGLPYFPHCYSLTRFESTLYAGIANHGVFKSVNYGLSWIPVNNGIESKTIYSLLVDANDIYGCDSEGGLYYSPDDGQTWQPRNGGFGTNQIVKLAFADAKLLAAVSGGIPGLYASTNKGISWSKLSINASLINNMVVADNAIYVVGGNPTLISRDFGTTWTTSLIGTTGFHILVGLFAQGDRVVVGAGDSTLYVSEDEGRNWEVINNLPYPGKVNSVRFSDNQYCVGGQEGFYFSPDNGITWQARSNGLRNHIISYLAANDSMVVAATPDDGIFISKNHGNSWSEINEGLRLPDGYGYLEGIRIMGIGWTKKALTIGVFAKGIYQSINFGQSWTQKLNTSGELLLPVLCDGLNIFAVSQSRSTPDYYQYTSVDGGNTWTKTLTSVFNNNTIRAGLLKGDTIVTGNWNNLLISQDFGNTWRISNFDQPRGSNAMLLLDTCLYVSTGNGLYRSPDLGLSWIKLQNGLPTGEVNGLIFHEKKLFVGSTEGVFVSYDSGDYWFPWNKNLGSVEVGDGSYFGTFPLAADSSFLYAGTYGQSVWRKPYNNMIDVTPDDAFICRGQLATLSVPPGSNNIKWTTLTDTTTVLSSSPVLSVNPVDTSMYRVRLKYDHFQIVDTTTVFVYPEIKVDLGKDTLVCGSEILMDAGSEAVSFIWQDNARDRFYNVTNAGVYSVQVENQFGCKSSDSREIKFAKPPIVDLGDDLVLCGAFYPIRAGWGNNQFLWSTGSQDSVITPIAAGKYWVAVKNECGQAVDSITVMRLDNTLLPNVVTANGDTKNDRFEVTLNDAISPGVQLPIVLRIFNRWGTRIYETDNYRNEWPADGNDLSSGVYYYTLDISACPTVKGWIQILKN